MIALVLGGAKLIAAENDFVTFGIHYRYQPSGVSAISQEIPRGLARYEKNEGISLGNLLGKSNLIYKKEESLSPDGMTFIRTERLGDRFLNLPLYMPLDAYYSSEKSASLRRLWDEKVAADPLPQEGQQKEQSIELIGADIAGQRVSLRVMGNISISGKLANQSQSGQVTNYRESKTTSFVLDQTQSFNIEGRVGDRVSIKVDQDSERDFNFENTLKIFYTGEEDEILQKVDAGNISLALPSTQFITGKANTQGLFGIKALLKVGPVDLTAIASVEEGQNKKMQWGGDDAEPTRIKDYEYLRNRYYFLSEDFRREIYPLDSKGRFTIERQVLDFELYKTTNPTDVGAFQANAYLNPNDTLNRAYIEEGRYFKRLVRDVDYVLNENLGYFKILSFVNTGDVLAVAYRDSILSSGLVMTHGDFPQAGETPKNLKLIRPTSPNPKHPTWPLEFKNVYYLGAQGINSDGFDLQIFYSAAASPTDRDASGKSYLQVFGLDNMNEAGVSGQPDEKIDNNPGILRLQEGELWIPFLQPFTSWDDTDDRYANLPDYEKTGLLNPELKVEESSHFLYDTTQGSQIIASDSKFYIEVKYSNRSSEIQLNDMMIIEGSEEIRANGVLLVKGVDYTIDYFSGRINLISDVALSPSANLDISYNSRQLFQLDKKTVAGMRAEYKFGKSNFLGGTFMYFNESSIDDQVRVGDEPFRNMIWDINGDIRQDINWLTRGINALPLIETYDQSSFRLSGEIAQIIPNPNTISNEKTGDPNGVANIDDFEGAKKVTPLGVERKGWYYCSRPINNPWQERAFTYWYNPYIDVPTKNIWPDKEVSANMQNDVTRTMMLVIDPRTNQMTGKESSHAPREMWGGVMRSLYSGAYDQKETKFIEIWAKGTRGTLRFDMGKISEDLDLVWNEQLQDFVENKKLDSEDKPEPGTGFTVGNGLLEDEENIGINGLTDEEELALGIDPKVDNYSFTPGSGHYRYINGTEANTDEGGYIPDTEDINRNNWLDLENDYFTYELDLEDPGDYFVTETEFRDGAPTGWRLYRIPLSDTTEVVGNPEMEMIQFFRISYGNVTGPDSVQFASIGLVGNEWQELGIAENDSARYVLDDERFSVTVINTEDNPEYEPPDGVQGKLDRVYNIRSKEQSLAFKIAQLNPGHLAVAQKTLWQEENYLTYRSIKMFVHGDEGLRSYTEPPIRFFIRLGRSAGAELTDYYEVETPLYAGWDDRNSIELIFDEITRLKEYGPGNLPDDTLNYDYYFSADGRIREFTNQNTGQTYRVVGEPSFSRINKFLVGVRNVSDASYTGEIWLNELRVSDPLREKGIAFRGAFDLDIAGLASINFNASYEEAEFHQVNQKDPLSTSRGKTGDASNLQDKESYNVNIKLNPHRLLPKAWNINMPVVLNYSESKNTPKYFPGSDIRMAAVPDSLIAQTQKRGFNTNLRKNSKSDFWLAKYTLDAASASFSYSEQIRSDRLTKQNSTSNYAGKFEYDVKFSKGDGIAWLKWIPFYGKKLEENKFFWKPNGFKFTIDGVENKRYNQPWQGEATYNPTLTLKRTFNTGYSPFNALSFTYNQNQSSTLDHYLEDKWAAVENFDPGFVTNYFEQSSANFSPKISSWLTPKFNYSSSFTANNNVDLPYFNAGNTRNLGGSFSLDPKKIIDSFGKSGKDAKSPAAPGRPGGGRPTARPGTAKPDTKQDGDEKDTKKSFSVKNILKESIIRIQPIQISLDEKRTLTHSGIGLMSALDSNLTEQSHDSTGHLLNYVDWRYRLGFAEAPSELILYDIVGTNAVKTNTNRNLSIRSGYKLSNKITTGFNFKIQHSDNKSGATLNESLVRSYLPIGETGKEGFPMADWNIKWSGLNSYKWLSKWTKSISMDHAFSGQEKLSYQNGDTTSHSFSQNFSPLVGISIIFKNDIDTKFRFNRTVDIINEQIDTRRTLNNSGTFTIGWSKRGGMTIPIPFYKKVNMENNINLSLNMTYSKRDVYLRRLAEGKFNHTEWNTNWKIQPELSYQFSRNITGSTFFMYGETSTPINPKKVSRDFGLKVNILIRG
jgi:hypothetical protein